MHRSTSRRRVYLPAEELSRFRPEGQQEQVWQHQDALLFIQKSTGIGSGVGRDLRDAIGTQTTNEAPKRSLLLALRLRNTPSSRNLGLSRSVRSRISQSCSENDESNINHHCNDSNPSQIELSSPAGVVGHGRNDDHNSAIASHTSYRLHTQNNTRYNTTESGSDGPVAHYPTRKVHFSGSPQSQNDSEIGIQNPIRSALEQNVDSAGGTSDNSATATRSILKRKYGIELSDVHLQTVAELNQTFASNRSSSTAVGYIPSPDSYHADPSRTMRWQDSADSAVDDDTTLDSDGDSTMTDTSQTDIQRNDYDSRMLQQVNSYQWTFAGQRKRNDYTRDLFDTAMDSMRFEFENNLQEHNSNKMIQIKNPIQQNRMNAGRQKQDDKFNTSDEMMSPQQKYLAAKRQAQLVILRQQHALARAWQDQMHPRVYDPRVNGLRPFPLCSATAGRHCFPALSHNFCCDLCGEGAESDLSCFGPGISNYFKMVKWLIWLFFALFLCALPAFAICIATATSSTTDQTVLSSISEFGLHHTMFSALGSGSNFTQVQLPFTSCGESLCSISKSDAAMLFGISDVIGGIIFIVAFIWVRTFEHREGYVVDRDHLTADDYSVILRNIPAETTETDILNHFRKLHLDPPLQVAEIHIARDEGSLIELTKQRGKFVKRIKAIDEKLDAISRISIPKQRGSPEKDQKRIRRYILGLQRQATKLQVKRRKLARKLGNQNRKIAKLRDKQLGSNKTVTASSRQLAFRDRGAALAAFVTFEYDEDAARIMDMYRATTQNCCLRRCQSRMLRMQVPVAKTEHSAHRSVSNPLRSASTSSRQGVNNHTTPETQQYHSARLIVRRAPPPSALLWPNFRFRRGARFIRRTFTTTLSLILLLLSTGFLLWASRTQQERASDQLKQPDCPADIDQQSRDTITASASLTRCYCQTLGFAELLNDSLCYSYVQTQTLAAVLRVLSSAAVAFVNLLLQFIMTRLTRFEKHHSVDGRAASLTRRLFLVQFVNTGVLTLLIHASITWLFGTGSTQYSDFVPEWYRVVGSAITLTMIFNIFTPHLFPIGKYLFRTCMRRCAVNDRGWTCCRKSSQFKLNRLFTGSDFRLSARYAQLLTSMFTAYIYSTGMPILLFIAMIGFSVSYWIDKFLFLRFYRTPPHYNAQLGKSITALLPLALLAHIGMSVWMLSEPTIFPFVTSTNEASGIASILGSGSFWRRICQPHTYILTIFFFLIGLAILLKQWIGGLLSFGFRCFSILTCGLFTSRKEYIESLAERIATPPYSQALKEGLLRGVPSYNILMNPLYAESFAISQDFAQKYRTVADVALHSPVATKTRMVFPKVQ